jgi:nucleotide-binding universal stress UspA family protein
MRILIAYDGSPDAEMAVEDVVGRPWPKRSKVRLVTVLETPLATAPANFEFYGPMIVGVETSLREEAYRSLQKALAKFKPREDLETSFEIKEGHPKSALLEAIQEWDADLAVVGSQGRTRMERLLLGSVSHALVTHAPCSVEVVRSRRKAA